MIVYKYAHGAAASKAAALALHHKLFVREWTLEDMYHHAITQSTTQTHIVMALDGKVPIAAILVFEDRCYGSIGIYVKPDYRRRKIGTTMYNMMKDKIKKDMPRGEFGIRGSTSFWKTVEPPVVTERDAFMKQFQAAEEECEDFVEYAGHSAQWATLTFPTMD